MVITANVQKQFFATGPPSSNQPTLIRLPPTVVVKYNVEDKAKHSESSEPPAQPPPPKTKSRRTNLWSVEEHNRFLHGLEMYPQGPWKNVAAVVGTKTTRQTMTHAQKYRQKIERRAKSDNLSPPVSTSSDASPQQQWAPPPPPTSQATSDSNYDRSNYDHARLLPRFADRYYGAHSHASQGHER